MVPVFIKTILQKPETHRVLLLFFAFLLCFGFSAAIVAMPFAKKTGKLYHPNFNLYIDAQLSVEQKDYHKALVSLSRIKPRENTLLPLLVKSQKINIFLKLQAFKSATAIYQTLPKSRLKNRLKQQFLVSLEKNALVEAFEFLDENLPEIQVEAKFLTLYLKTLPPNSTKYQSIIKRLWLVGDVQDLQQRKDPDFQKYLKTVQDNATAEQWQMHFQKQFKRKNYRYLLRDLPVFIQRQQKKKKPFVEASLLLVEIQYKLRRYSKLLETLERHPVLFQPKYANVYLYKVQGLLARKQPQLVEEFLKRLKRKPELKIIVNQLTLAYARHKFYYNRDYKESLLLFQKVQLKPLSKKQQEAMQWEKYFALHTVGNKPEAHQIYQWAFQQADFDSSVIGSSFCYWGLKYATLHKIADFQQQNPCFPKYANHFYGFRSWQKFTEDPTLNFDLTQDQTSTLQPELTAKLEWLDFLYQNEEFRLADTLILSASFEDNKESLAKIIELLHQHHRYYVAYVFANRWFPDWDTQLVASKDVLKAMFPLAYFSTVQKYAKRYQVSPFLVLSIIREESRFQPQIKSWAGAIGLMQIMPATGKSLVRQMKIKPSSLSTDIDFNIHLGTYYIKQLLKRFDNNAVYALAGYNGGPKNVKRWIHKQTSPDIDYFIEDIPFKETRHYVKRVLRSYYAYNWLYPQEYPNQNLVH